MQEYEDDEIELCAACGEALCIGAAADYGFGSSEALCWNCAIERGGSYDADQDRWIRPPKIGDLIDRE